jgi:hypothetical protein
MGPAAGRLVACQSAPDWGKPSRGGTKATYRHRHTKPGFAYFERRCGWRVGSVAWKHREQSTSHDFVVERTSWRLVGQCCNDNEDRVEERRLSRAVLPSLAVRHRILCGGRLRAAGFELWFSARLVLRCVCGFMPHCAPADDLHPARTACVLGGLCRRRMVRCLDRLAAQQPSYPARRDCGRPVPIQLRAHNRPFRQSSQPRNPGLRSDRLFDRRRSIGTLVLVQIAFKELTETLRPMRPGWLSTAAFS